MKPKMSSRIYLWMAVLILTAALAVPAAAQKLVPFNGAMQGHEIDTPGKAAAGLERVCPPGA